MEAARRNGTRKRRIHLNETFKKHPDVKRPDAFLYKSIKISTIKSQKQSVKNTISLFYIHKMYVKSETINPTGW